MNKMDWTKWSAIAEILSAIAIVVTLVYLAVQTQQNTQALVSQSRQGLFESAQQELPIWLEYPVLTAFIVDDETVLSMEEKMQLDALMILALSRREFAWRQHERGILDDDSWNDEREVIGLLVGAERTRAWWQEVGRFSFGEGFVSVVDLIIDGQPFHPYWERLGEWSRSDSIQR